MPRWSSSLRRFGRDNRGVSAVEFAVTLPLFVLLISGMVDIGRALHQANAVEKALRTGASFAARTDYPLSTADEATAKNLVRTGNPDGTLPYLVPGWADAGAQLTITVSTVTVDGNNIPVFEFAAVVPFDPILPGLAAAIILGGGEIRLNHEQAYIGI